MAFEMIVIAEATSDSIKAPQRLNCMLSIKASASTFPCVLSTVSSRSWTWYSLRQMSKDCRAAFNSSTSTCPSLFRSKTRIISSRHRSFSSNRSWIRTRTSSIHRASIVSSLTPILYCCKKTFQLTVQSSLISMSQSAYSFQGSCKPRMASIPDCQAFTEIKPVLFASSCLKYQCRSSCFLTTIFLTVSMISFLVCSLRRSFSSMDEGRLVVSFRLFSGASGASLS
mmetsp:Transcript_108625/g.187907  ORF Transcript_108625/g.187907 Transcript_108625/m.187907 type:complete len:226 (-) Transcript_108625:1309-1986(-)